VSIDEGLTGVSEEFVASAFIVFYKEGLRGRNVQSLHYSGTVTRMDTKCHWEKYVTVHQ